MKYSFYHKVTGLFAEHVYSACEPLLDLNTPADHVAIEGSFDPLSQKVDIATGQVIAYQPPAPSADHAWQADVKRWRLLPEVAERQEARRTTLTKIRELEASQGRAVREMLLTGDRTKLVEIDTEIAKLRALL